MKAIPYAIIAICAILIIAGAYYLGTRQVAPQVIHHTTIEADSIPANITYITQPGQAEPTEYAEMDTTLTLDDDKGEIGLRVGYDEFSNQFDLSADVTLKPPKTPFMKPYAQIGVGFQDGLKEADIGAGLLIKEKYMIGGYVDTDNTIGVRLGVIF